MHFFSKSLACALFACVEAVYLNNELSFGHNDKISPTLRAIPNFHLIGTPSPPSILSNKVILTPPAPGGQRGGIWAEQPLRHSEWTVDVDFRATGPERGGGNMQVWYVKQGQHDVGTSSIYTAGRFDGLAIVIDQYAGSGGFVRGFLNDGSKEFKSHHAVDSLAFGHCQYSYRNLGRPSRLEISHSDKLFKVTLDGKLCFESKDIKLPMGYSFGISAASANEPDSFEVFKFVTTTESHTPNVREPNAHQDNQQSFLGAPDKRQHQKEHPRELHVPDPADNIPVWNDMKEVLAEQVSSNEQFADVHNRLQGLTRHLLTTSRDLTHYQNLAATRHDQIIDLLQKLDAAAKAPIPQPQQNLQRLEAMEKKLEQISQDVRQTKSDFHNALDQHVIGLRNEVRDGHHTLLGTVKGAATGTGKFVLVVLGSQALTVGAYLLYKRRKNGGHKKYL